MPRRPWPPDLVVLFAKAIVELIALPFHVAWFLLNRGRIRRNVRAILEADAPRR